jgi:predicted nucleotidyltransferase
VDRAEFEGALRDVVATTAPDAIVAVYLYGSRARGTAKPTSDVDLGVLVRGPVTPRLGGAPRDLETAVERALQLPVEAVVLNTAPADLVHRVLRDGVLVLDRDRSFRLQFEVRSRNEYFDLEPIRRLYRRPA